MAKIFKALRFVLCLLPISLVAGYFVGLYQLEIYSEELLPEIIAQLGSTDIFIVLCIAQTAGYAVFCGLFGYLIAEKIGLWKSFELDKSKLIVTILVSLVGGIVFSLDYWVFGNLIEGVKEADVEGLSANSVIASVLYGGVIEEVMMRLFVMSLIALVIWKLFFKKYDSDSIPTVVFAIANIIAALGFAAGHLPATVMIFGELTPMILIRCFLLNGGFGLLFGWLYRKYGIVYAMLSHTLFHVVSKAIWLIFI